MMRCEHIQLLYRAQDHLLVEGVSCAVFDCFLHLRPTVIDSSKQQSENVQGVRRKFVSGGAIHRECRFFYVSEFSKYPPAEPGALFV
jgi:hypothetical protein